MPEHLELFQRFSETALGSPIDGIERFGLLPGSGIGGVVWLDGERIRVESRNGRTTAESLEDERSDSDTEYHFLSRFDCRMIFDSQTNEYRFDAKSKYKQGDTKERNGKTYVLNSNSRWARADKPAGGKKGASGNAEVDSSTVKGKKRTGKAAIDETIVKEKKSKGKGTSKVVEGFSNEVAKKSGVPAEVVSATLESNVKKSTDRVQKAAAAKGRKATPKELAKAADEGVDKTAKDLTSKPKAESKPAETKKKGVADKDVWNLMDGLDDKHGGLIPIHEIRARMSDASKEDFDNKLLDMQANGELYLQTGEAREATQAQKNASIDSPIRGLLFYASRGDNAPAKKQVKLSELPKAAQKKTSFSDLEEVYGKQSRQELLGRASMDQLRSKSGRARQVASNVVNSAASRDVKIAGPDDIKAIQKAVDRRARKVGKSVKATGKVVAHSAEPQGRSKTFRGSSRKGGKWAQSNQDKYGSLTDE